MIPIFNYIKEEQCCGCSACIGVCPKKALSMESNEEGFLYPRLDEDRCCKCNQCVKVCPIINKKKVHKSKRVVYGGYIENNKLLSESASGGAFMALAQTVLDKKGYVAGVVYSNDFKEVFHICSNNIEDLKKMRGSKYVQSDKKQVYKQVESQLRANHLVLFTGLPCEVAGLKSYLKVSYEKLVTCELICHGATSPKINKEYVEDLCKKYQSSLETFTVRYKRKGKWVPHYIKADFKNGSSYLKPFYASSYGMAFSVLKRKSCYECNFKGENTQADLIIGDYWGKYKGDEGYNESGVSVITTNTLNGDKLVSSMKGFNLYDTTYEDVVSNNVALIKSVKRDINRDIFLRYLKEEGLEQAARKGISTKQVILKWIPVCIYEAIPRKLLKRIRRGINLFSSR